MLKHSKISATRVENTRESSYPPLTPLPLLAVAGDFFFAATKACNRPSPKLEAMNSLRSPGVPARSTGGSHPACLSWVQGCTRGIHGSPGSNFPDSKLLTQPKLSEAAHRYAIPIPALCVETRTFPRTRVVRIIPVSPRSLRSSENQTCLGSVPSLTGRK